MESQSDPDMDALGSPILHALFDALTHHQMYAEIQSVKRSQVIRSFGPPLSSETQSSCPLSQLLMRKFVLTIPGLSKVDSNFWTFNVVGLVGAIADSNLSESYDKGCVGIRRTMAAAAAALCEGVSRGVLGGVALMGTSDGGNAREELSGPVQGWAVFVQEAIYGDRIARSFAKVVETELLSNHDQVTQDAHEYCLIKLASFLHYALLQSPQGQTMLSLLTRINDMLPYFLIRQTLRVGNAATMLNQMTRLVLAKMSLSSWTSWISGSSSDDGTNLLQYIISVVLKWDVDQLEKRAREIRKRQASATDHFEKLDEYPSFSADLQEQIRTRSLHNAIPIVTCILTKEDDEPVNFSDEQLDALLEYLGLILAARDRRELISAFCKHRPDLLTSSVRQVVAAHEPIIRAFHAATDLSQGTQDMQCFINDLLTLCTPKNGAEPTIEQMCQLLKKHAPKLHVFLHQATKNGPKLAQEYQQWATEATRQYACKKGPKVRASGAGDMSDVLQGMLDSLPAQDRQAVDREMREYSSVLLSLQERRSANKDRTTQDESCHRGQFRGDGQYLFKWQMMIKESYITPASVHGGLRTGASASVKEANAINLDGSPAGIQSASEKQTSLADSKRLQCPRTIELLRPRFEEYLRELNSEGSN